MKEWAWAISASGEALIVSSCSLIDSSDKDDTRGAIPLGLGSSSDTFTCKDSISISAIAFPSIIAILSFFY